MKFKTKAGNQYLYDNYSGMVFNDSDGFSEVLEVCQDQNKPLEQVIRSLKHRYAPEAITRSYQFIHRWHSKCGAFFSDKHTSGKLTEPYEQTIEQHLQMHGYKELILSVTENCNLACQYCVFSPTYPSMPNLSKTKTKMSWKIAEKALVDYLDKFKQIRKRNPYRKPVIAFYGGEPLLNLKFIQKAIEFANGYVDSGVDYTLTTNGTLLTDSIVDFLVENEVGICVSLDGPPEEHDRLRTFHGGGGSGETVIANLKRFMHRYPDYARALIISTYDWKTPLSKVHEFFEQQSDNLPHVGRVAPVSGISTDYYNQFTTEDYHEFCREYERLEQTYDQLLGNGQCSSSGYIDNLIGGFPKMILLRSIAESPPVPFLPASSSCVPGDKISVGHDGKYYMCERVSKMFPIGDVDSGVDTKQVVNVITEFQRKVLRKCAQCPISRLCFDCYQQFECEGTFAFPSQDYCSRISEHVQKQLTYTYSLLEAHPVTFPNVIQNYYERLSWYDIRKT